MSTGAIKNLSVVIKLVTHLSELDTMMVFYWSHRSQSRELIWNHATATTWVFHIRHWLWNHAFHAHHLLSALRRFSRETWPPRAALRLDNKIPDSAEKDGCQNSGWYGIGHTRGPLCIFFSSHRLPLWIFLHVHDTIKRIDRGHPRYVFHVVVATPFISSD